MYKSNIYTKFIMTNPTIFYNYFSYIIINYYNKIFVLYLKNYIWFKKKNILEKNKKMLNSQLLSIKNFEIKKYFWYHFWTRMFLLNWFISLKYACQGRFHENFIQAKGERH